VQPDAPTEYTLTVRNWVGLTSSAKVAVNVARIAQFDSDPVQIGPGQPAKLTWRIDGATSSMQSTISPDVGIVNSSGQQTVSPEATTDYTLTLTAPDGSTQQRSVTISVQTPRPQIDVFTSPTTVINPGQQVRLTWSIQNAELVQIKTGDGRNIVDTSQANGSISDAPTGPTTYLLTATNSGGFSQTAFNLDVRSSGPDQRPISGTPQPTATPATTPPPTDTPTPTGVPTFDRGFSRTPNPILIERVLTRSAVP
jgi:hypothetical protein